MSLPSAALGRARAERFDLALPSAQLGALAAGWLALGVFALIGSGLFSVLLVLARTPHVAAWVPGVDFFRVALVVHVDLSVLVWFVSMAGMLWTLNGSQRALGLGWLALWATAIGALLIAASAFVGRPVPIMSNYVPVLESGTFLYGLAVVGAGFSLLTLRSFVAPARVGRALDGADALRFGLKASALAAAVALFAMVWSLVEVPRTLEGRDYYEMLFWGPGHVVQFAWTLLMLVGWAWLASLSDAPMPLGPRVVALVFGISVLSVFIAPPIYLNWPVASVEHQKMMTWLMRFGGGLGILPIALGVAAGLALAGRAQPAQRPLRASLLASLLLFCVGGVLGFMIEGSDVRVPAHYHGSIVGVTLALMGLVYALLPRLGASAPRGRLAWIQPWLYGGGQLLHIIGLMWSGGYGVQRKVAGSEQVLRSTAEVLGMGLMGLGGAIAIAGGVAFAVVVIGCAARAPRSERR